MGGMVVRRVVAPTVEPVSLSEAKLFLRVSHTLEDSLLGSLIRAAREGAERHLRRSLITQQWLVIYRGGVPAQLPLPMGPVLSVQAVTVRYRNGSSETLEAERYRLAADGERLLLESALAAEEVEVAYTAGFGPAANDVPPCIVQGILLHIASLYEHRDSPAAASVYLSLYAPYRMMGV